MCMMYYYNQPFSHSLSFVPMAIFGSLMGLFWIIVIFIFLYFFKQIKHRDHFGHNSMRSNSPENMLKERFVKGEISDEDYKRMKRILSEDIEDKK